MLRYELIKSFKFLVTNLIESIFADIEYLHYKYTYDVTHGEFKGIFQDPYP